MDAFYPYSPFKFVMFYYYTSLLAFYGALAISITGIIIIQVPIIAGTQNSTGAYIRSNYDFFTGAC